MIEYLLSSLKVNMLLSGSECAVVEIDHPQPDFAREQVCEPRSLMEAFERTTSSQDEPRVDVSFDASEEPVLTPSPTSPSPQDSLSSTSVRASSVTAAENEVADIMQSRMSITRLPLRPKAGYMYEVHVAAGQYSVCLIVVFRTRQIYVSCRHASNH